MDFVTVIVVFEAKVRSKFRRYSSFYTKAVIQIFLGGGEGMNF